MDIGGISSAYSDLYGTTAGTSTSELEKQLDADYSQATDDELMDACKEFEAYFLEQMFKEMMKTVPKTEGSSGSGANMLDYYKDQMLQNIAAESTEHNSLGIAQTLYEQMRRNYGLDMQN